MDLKTTGGSITNTAHIIASSSITLDASKNIINQNQISLTGSGTLSLKAGGNIRNNREYEKSYKFIKEEELKSNFPPAKAVDDTMWGVSTRSDTWDLFDGTLGEYKVDLIDSECTSSIEKRFFIYEDKKKSEISSIQPQINSGGILNLMVNL